ncbi:MAG TPA: FMN-binding protein, partial [Spirochaetia bacterium]|nr:FMN-binding protein [Spirochaetia bacterium]
SMRYRPLIVPGAVGVLLLAIALVFGIRFGNAQSRFQAVIQKTAPAATPAPTAALVDGTRSATFQEGEVAAEVEVTVTSGRIDSMRLVSATNVDAALARTIFSRVKSAGSTSVDAVSGATASSAVLLKAITAAATAR